jgi:hypothetical protein
MTVTLTVSNAGGSDAMTIAGIVTIGHAPMPTPGTYVNNITGGKAATNHTVGLFNDGGFSSLITHIFPSNTDNVDVGAALGDLGRPFTMNMGGWWVVIVIGVLGFGMILSHGGNTILTGLTLMFGNVVLWVFLPFDWLGAVVSMIIFSFSIAVYAYISKK